MEGVAVLEDPLLLVLTGPLLLSLGFGFSFFLSFSPFFPGLAFPDLDDSCSLDCTLRQWPVCLGF